jgi:4-aminobutyrate aminotransferase-like enzyme
VAAFISEPILGEGGIIVPPREYFTEVKKILDQYGILFIDDEVQTGFGRTGKLFGLEHYGVRPDILTMAKAIAAGLPLAACTTREDIGNSFQPGDHLSTFGGNPVSCAAALANIDYILEENLSAESERKGQYITKALEEVKKGSRLIGDVRGKGLMIGIELVRDQNTKEPAAQEATKIRDACRRKGVLLGQGGIKANVLRIQPPLVISTQEIDQVIRVLSECLEETEKGSP